MKIDESLRNIFKMNKKIIDETPRLELVISIREALDILEISETSLRRSIRNGEYLEEKGDFRKIGASMFFDRESILNRKSMDHETYWFLKEESEKEQLNNDLFSDEYNSDSSLENATDINLEILENVKQIREMLEGK